MQFPADYWASCQTWVHIVSLAIYYPITCWRQFIVFGICTWTSQMPSAYGLGRTFILNKVFVLLLFCVVLLVSAAGIIICSKRMRGINTDGFFIGPFYLWIKIINKSLCCSLFNYTVNSRWTIRWLQEVGIDFETVNVNMVQKWKRAFSGIALLLSTVILSCISDWNKDLQ